MISTFYPVILAFFCLLLVNHGLCTPLPDSAGHVPQPKGLAYGGIPYGSISGQLSLYFGDYEPIVLMTKITDGDVIQLL